MINSVFQSFRDNIQVGLVMIPVVIIESVRSVIVDGSHVYDR